jgi:hypothetical protein
MLYAIVNALRSPQKAIIWNDIKNGKSLKEIRLSWYQTIYKAHYWVSVKFEDGLSSRSQEKWDSKKWDFFPGEGLPFLYWRGLKLKKIWTSVKMWTFLTSIFSKELPISQNRDGQHTVKFNKHHGAMHIYRLIPRNQHYYAVCGRERFEKSLKSDQLEWYQKWEVIQSSQAFLVSVDK